MNKIECKIIKNYKIAIKKKIKIVICLAIMVIILIKFASPFFVLPNEIRELNSNSNLPYKFAAPLEEYYFEHNEWKRDVEYQSIYYSNQAGDYLLFKGFPDLSNSYKFSYYHTKSPKISVLGIQIGDNIDEAEYILLNYDYKKLKSDDYSYKKGRITIRIKIQLNPSKNNIVDPVRNSVDEISISLYSTDWLHKGYYK